MARRNESTTEKIVRLFKEGKSVELIAKELGMPKDNVPKILEKHMPDYAEYANSKGGEQPAPEQDNSSDSAKKGFTSLFGKKKNVKDNQPEPEPKPAKININLTMNESGFVDGTVRGIAQMLQNGKDVTTIADFFNRDEEDIIAVRECMDEHFKRANEPEQNNTQESSQTETTQNQPSYSTRGSVYGTTGVENMSEGNMTEPVSVQSSSGYTPPKFDAPDISAKNSESETMDEMPSIDPVSLEVLDKQIEELDKKKAEKDAKTEKMPAVEMADVHIDSIVDSIGSTDTDNNIKEDDTMSPMEKMKQFAQQQIDENNKKISELKSKKVDVDNVTYELDRKAETINQQIAEAEKKIAELRQQISGFEEQKAKASAAVKEINDSIAEIEKENEEFESYFK